MLKFIRDLKDLDPEFIISAGFPLVVFILIGVFLWAALT